MFDRYVQGTKPSWKRRAVLIVSLALHGAAAIGLLIYSIFHVEEVTPPALAITFFSAAPPPPPPPPPAKKKTETKHIVEKKIVTPTTIPQLVQPKEEKKEEEDSSDDDGVEGGVEGGVKGGTVGGVVGGVIGGQLGAGPPKGPPPKPKNVPPHALDAAAIYKPDPHLPDIVKIQRKGTGAATFMAKVCVDQDGKVFQVNVMQGIPGADGEIVNTIRTWKYKPQPIPVCFLGNWVFTIE